MYLTPNGIESHIGGYDSFASRTAVKEEKKSTDKALDYKEQKRLEAEKRKTINRFKKVEELIEQLEAEVDEINTEMQNPKYSTDFTKLAELSKTAEEKRTEIEGLMEEWEQLQITIEENGYEI